MKRKKSKFLSLSFVSLYAFDDKTAAEPEEGYN